jgi:hypothetical protein
LRNGLKYSRATVLPDTLCIHLKRFRHDFAFSSKISTRVTFPLVDLDMSPWLHKDSDSKVSFSVVFQVQHEVVSLLMQAAVFGIPEWPFRQFLQPFFPFLLRWDYCLRIPVKSATHST